MYKTTCNVTKIGTNFSHIAFVKGLVVASTYIDNFVRVTFYQNVKLRSVILNPKRTLEIQQHEFCVGCSRL